MLLTDEGRQRVAEIAARHGFSAEAAEVLLAALVAGNGTQAQFSHPELGGMGQWSMGGMIMIGDMFNNMLKARVDGLANELAGLVGSIAQYVPAAPAGQAPAAGGFGAGGWPADLGQPSSSGSQNGVQYAVFPGTRRLAIVTNGQMAIYDTGDHMIGGVSQQQGGSSSLVFTSQQGTVPVDSLPRLDAGAPAATPAPAAAPASVEAPPAAGASQDEIVAKISQLHALFEKGVLSQAEFEAKKAELLSRI